ncbi:uncharacterized protein CIMG_02736 [Coccidioides immitis RS]|uniref:Uncharacterized protein n=2 Tax=Coccidioides immitis TaxID=5501 RepID=J3KM03_COCIM|nr:uncharacterized protein CIMG_02736 [Coccidioides immitis RS]EAS37382.3 hypothetical protein CIMG_02736 [Coccidioides immitis RS]KMU77088.1 hypothetical protein CISG_06126 [Coccidioides immitis RMSCC 3703]
MEVNMLDQLSTTDMVSVASRLLVRDSTTIEEKTYVVLHIANAREISRFHDILMPILEKLLDGRTEDDTCVEIKPEPPRDLQTAVLMAIKAILLDLTDKAPTTYCARLKPLLEQEGLLPEARSLQDFIRQLLGIPRGPTEVLERVLRDAPSRPILHSLQDLSDNLGWDFAADKPDSPAIYAKCSLKIEGSPLENIQPGLERLAMIYPRWTFRILEKGGGPLISSCNYYPSTK